MTKRRSVRKSSKKRRATKRSTFRSRMMKRIKFWGGDNLKIFINIINKNSNTTIGKLKEILKAFEPKLKMPFIWNIEFIKDNHMLQKWENETLIIEDLLQKINHDQDLIDEIKCAISVTIPIE